jgi:exodeoxyribonuclease VII large subunit
MRHALQASRSRLGEPAHRLEALSPLGVLSRGYAIVQGRDGKIATDASNLEPGTRIEARLRRGRVSATVDEVHTEDEK